MSERRQREEPFSGPERRSRIEDVEAWWFLVARILAFFLGLSILGATALLSDVPTLTEKLFWATIAIGLMWPVVGAGVAQAFQTLRGRPR